ncbi:GNAT family N-acetyltransferase [Radiobacillus kanasensis]|uniref:GNAT family N-acetyltransferase n=1 Tax=Radiobacillus kanasensis TaxID=2844358 RepID=UPI001E54F924|nr:GNAT family N-acetyltransferase [Radiobacillus kanasensis]UFT99221.1 GNAT family N-acetyltransferase [Radiobacillus kanasensis]
MVEVTIAFNREADIELAHHIMIEAFKEYQNLPVPSSAIYESLDSWKDSFNVEIEKYIVCFSEGKAVGSARFVLKKNQLYFFRVSVLPEARGKGIAKAMLNWLETFALDQGLKILQCRVRSGLSKNVQLYTSLGYRIESEETVKNPNGHLVETVVMEKHLK